MVFVLLIGVGFLDEICGEDGWELLFLFLFEDVDCMDRGDVVFGVDVEEGGGFLLVLVMVVFSIWVRLGLIL